MAKVKNKAKKKNLSDKIAKPKLAKKKVMNPFEVHVNRQKYNVLGRKTKNDRGLPGVARTKAISKRKKTLLQEYSIKDKSNKFMDRRIGEKNSAMTSEDRIMARFTAERMKKHNKKSIFNLADDEVLTHRGQTLNEIEKFDDPRSDDEEEKEKLDADFVEDAHFGGGILKKSNSETSRKNMIEQLIAESKKRKAEKQKAREQTIELTEKLDTEWKDLLPIMSASKKSINSIDDEKPDSYDTAMRQLKFEARGKPADKLKTEEELAKEEKEQLEKLEEERLQRMSDTQEVIRKKHKSADDLDDGFDIDSDDNDMLTYNVDGQVETSHTFKEVYEENKVEDSEKSSDDKDGDGEDSNSDDSSDDDDNEDNLSDLKNLPHIDDDDEENKSNNEINDEDAKINEVNHLTKKQNIQQDITKELPYTFHIPSTYEELQTLLKVHSYTEQAVILERMIKCNHPSLGEGYKDKLSTLFAFLLQHLQDTAISEAENCFSLLDHIAPYLYDLCHISAEKAGHYVAEVIKEKQQDLKSSYPRLDTLIFLKLVSLLFPTSDFRHPVVTPTLAYMCQVLDQCRVKTSRDVAVGLFITTLILEYTILSKRFSPVAINFLHGIINMAITKTSTKLFHIVHPIYISNAARTLLVINENSAESCIDPGLMCLTDLRGEAGEDFKVRALNTVIKLLHEFCSNLKDIPASYQIFAPLLNTINKLDLQKYPIQVTDNVKSLVCSIEILSQQKLQHLVIEKKKPKPLRMYEPRIEEVMEGRKKRNVSKERQERDKLMHKYKREMKGAIREIRRDKAFLAKVKFTQTLKSDLERKQKVKEIYGSAAMQQGELRKLKRKK
ncbi:hypothetical protein L9F63_006127 [Diploptera punctata]|uniref:Nucleolar protein 14 homolog n=1 Tax=Diploptera punctata TaxID=6984 RepID=A0AAD8E4T6_DIPPU|nr:hypothetical protein L9F63_006127 [Diploptera punctata]